MSSRLEGTALKKFSEWTAGLSEREALLSVYNNIRDIPYYIDLRYLSPVKGQSVMLDSGRGACFAKHYLMGNIFTHIGFQVKYVLYSFFWHKQTFFSSEMASPRGSELPETYHMACMVRASKGWVLADATWDRSLKSAGFDVNLDWDGIKDTQLAVISELEISLSDDDRELEELIGGKFSSYTVKERMRLVRFTANFNRWLSEKRAEGSAGRAE